MWLLTSEYNEYDQYGEYFVAAFSDKPTLEKLKEVLPDVHENVYQHILLNGGGREDGDYVWYSLVPYKLK